MRAALLSFTLIALVVPSLVTADPGQLDPTFGSGGSVVDPTTGSGRALAVQPDGAIVVVQAGSRLVRYDATGTLDPSFGTGGVVTTAIDGSAVALQADGMIVVAGNVAGQLAVARYDGSGTPDPLFGTGGVVTVPIAGFGGNVVLQSTGAIVTGGNSLLARFTSGGVLDSTFGTGGTVDTSANGTVTSLALAAGDAVVTAGQGGLQVAIVRYDSEGAPDAGFGVGGVFTTDADAVSTLNGVTVQTDGAIVATGFSSYLNLLVMRVTSAGILDATFGGDGIVETYFSMFSLGDSVVMEGNKVVVAGASVIAGPVQSGSTSDVGLARYASDGVLDGGFGFDGIVATNLGQSESVNAAVRSGQTLVVTGTRQTGGQIPGPQRFFVARYQLGELCAVDPSCKGAVPAKSGLQLRADANPEKDKLQWTYRKGDATTLAKLGDPTTTDRYLLCMFDESTPTPTVDVTIVIPAGGTCDGKPCWSPVGSGGFRYKSKLGVPRGIAQLAIKAGAAGKPQITLKGRGTNLPPLGLPRAVPTRVQLQSAAGGCWQSTFSAAGVSKNDELQFKAKSD